MHRMRVSVQGREKMLTTTTQKENRSKESRKNTYFYCLLYKSLTHCSFLVHILSFLKIRLEQPRISLLHTHPSPMLFVVPFSCHTISIHLTCIFSYIILRIWHDNVSNKMALWLIKENRANNFFCFIHCVPLKIDTLYMRKESILSPHTLTCHYRIKCMK